MHDLFISLRRLVFIEEPFCLVMHKVTKDLERILLLNLLLFKQLCNFSDSFPDILEQISLLIPFLCQDVYFGLCLVFVVADISKLEVKALHLVP